jgi:hypothetical protein
MRGRIEVANKIFFIAKINGGFSADTAICLASSVVGKKNPTEPRIV